MIWKLCPDCGRKRPASQFHKNRRSKDGLASYCKEHGTARTKARQAAQRAAMGDEAYLQYRALLTTRRRARVGPDADREYNRAVHHATRRLIEAHRDEYDRYLTAARRRARARGAA